jgi:hypothetical protein
MGTNAFFPCHSYLDPGLKTYSSSNPAAQAERVPPALHMNTPQKFSFSVQFESLVLAAMHYLYVQFFSSV